MSFFENFHFLRPWWLLALLFLAVFGKIFFTHLKNTSAWEAVCDKKLLDFLIIKGSSQQRLLVQYSALIGIVFGIIALSGPTWRKNSIPVFSPSNPVMILLNLSSDMDNTDITPTRLARAKFGIDDLIKKLTAQVGLIVYANEPYLITPLTEDTHIITNLLPAVERNIMPENGDRLNRAVDLAVERLKQGDYPYGNIVVFTPDVGQEFNAALSAVEKSSDLGYRVSIVGVSSSDNEKLKMLASKGNGIYISISANIDRLAESINSHISSELQKTENQQETWEDSGYWFLLIPLLCCLYFFRRGILIIMLFLVLSSNAFAGFFTNSDQDGAKAFANGDYATAAHSFNNTDWRAAALYRNGDYQEALKLYQQKDDVENMYNQGNSLAKSGQIDEAIKQYEKVLEINSEHEDAKFNLEYLKQQKNQNQSQQNQSQDNQSEDNPQNGADNQQQGQDDEQDSSEQNQPDEDSQNNNDNNDSDSQGNNQDSSSPSDKNSDNNQDDDNSSQPEGKSPQNSPSDDNGSPQQSSAEQTVPSGTPNDKTDEDVNAVIAKPSDEQGEFNEEVQAREVTYRNIPENPGGLLRAFIYKEYIKNRYGDK